MPHPRGAPKTPGSGRAKGTANKATIEARQAIASFVDANAHRLTEWLDAVAAGDPANGVAPDPGKAFALFQSVIEYHVPKLTRTDATLTGAGGAPLSHSVQIRFVDAGDRGN